MEKIKEKIDHKTIYIRYTQDELDAMTKEKFIDDINENLKKKFCPGGMTEKTNNLFDIIMNKK